MKIVISPIVTGKSRIPPWTAQLDIRIRTNIGRRRMLRVFGKNAVHTLIEFRLRSRGGAGFWNRFPVAALRQLLEAFLVLGLQGVLGNPTCISGRVLPRSLLALANWSPAQNFNHVWDSLFVILPMSVPPFCLWSIRFVPAIGSPILVAWLVVGRVPRFDTGAAIRLPRLGSGITGFDHGACEHG
jgi:hypothetical protein